MHPSFKTTADADRYTADADRYTADADRYTADADRYTADADRRHRRAAPARLVLHVQQREGRAGERGVGMVAKLVLVNSYATAEDTDTARGLGVTVQQLRADRAREDV